MGGTDEDVRNSTTNDSSSCQLGSLKRMKFQWKSRIKESEAKTKSRTVYPDDPDPDKKIAEFLFLNNFGWR